VISSRIQLVRLCPALLVRRLSVLGADAAWRCGAGAHSHGRGQKPQPNAYFSNAICSSAEGSCARVRYPQTGALGVSFHVTSALQSQSGARHESRQCRYDGYFRQSCARRQARQDPVQLVPPERDPGARVRRVGRRLRWFDDRHVARARQKTAAHHSRRDPPARSRLEPGGLRWRVRGRGDFRPLEPPHRHAARGGGDQLFHAVDPAGSVSPARRFLPASRNSFDQR
jgi:hypothetical protein